VLTNETNNFSGKVAFVTGAASGIGRATAVAFAREGADVVVADVAPEGAEQTVRMIEESGGRALALRCDVSHAEDVKAALEKTVEQFGRLDCAFNNAGIEESKLTVEDFPVEYWDRIIGINLRGVFLCMKYEIPAMLRQGSGAIVNNSSIAGIVGLRGAPAYTASKHGVVGLTKTTALDFALKNIRINAVCPGLIDTPMVDQVTRGSEEGRQQLIALEPVGRMGKPEEIAAAVVWLCSDSASFITGHALPIDGGFLAGIPAT